MPISLDQMIEAAIEKGLLKKKLGDMYSENTISPSPINTEPVPETAVTIMELRTTKFAILDNHCRYVLDAKNENGDFLYCGAPRHDKISPWCTFHHNLTKGKAYENLSRTRSQGYRASRRPAF